VTITNPTDPAVTVTISQLVKIALELGYYDEPISGHVSDYLAERGILLEASTDDVKYILSFTSKHKELWFRIQYSHIL